MRKLGATHLMEFGIRPYQSTDLAAVSRICLGTGDSGRDACSLYRDHDLLGLYYASPYVVFEPELCTLLTYQSKPCGYVLGTHNSDVFSDRCEREWFPPLRQRYPLPADNDHSLDANLVRLIHAGRPRFNYFRQYPAHLHLDLLPIAQGQGWGPKLMELFLSQLRAFKVPGVHLSVGRQNDRGIRFYRRMDFQQIDEDDQSFVMARYL